jgi:hypothetical protein
MSDLAIVGIVDLDFQGINDEGLVEMQTYVPYLR